MTHGTLSSIMFESSIERPFLYSVLQLEVTFRESKLMSGLNEDKLTSNSISTVCLSEVQYSQCKQR